MIKIFAGSGLFALVDNKEVEKVSKDFNRVLPFSKEINFRQLSLDLMKTDNPEKILIHFNDEQVLFDRFKKGFRRIDAAGGIVINQKDNSILMIKRFDKWDLPKGKLESGETLEEAAEREVQEECNISHLRVTKFIGPTYHIYPLKGEMILKSSYWYEMEITQEPRNLTPQTEEGITEIIWVKRNQLQEYLNNTYGTIHHLLKTYAI